MENTDNFLIVLQRYLEASALFCKSPDAYEKKRHSLPQRAYHLKVRQKVYARDRLRKHMVAMRLCIS